MGEKKRQKTMRKFDYSILKDRTWDNGILSYVSQIQEYKGKQELFTRQKPRELKRLIEIARIQNTESSNRIEGIVTTNPRSVSYTHLSLISTLKEHCHRYRRLDFCLDC